MSRALTILRRSKVPPKQRCDQLCLESWLGPRRLSKEDRPRRGTRRGTNRGTGGRLNPGWAQISCRKQTRGARRGPHGGPGDNFFLNPGWARSGCPKKQHGDQTGDQTGGRVGPDAVFLRRQATRGTRRGAKRGTGGQLFFLESGLGSRRTS